MDAIIHSIAGLGSFALYFGLSILMLFIFKLAYALVTPHDEWQLVNQDNNQAAAVGFGGALVGFCIALSGAAANSESLLDFAIWGVVALIAQVLAFLLLRFTFMPHIAERITSNQLSAGTMLAAVSIGIGMLNAACMTY